MFVCRCFDLGLTLTVLFVIELYLVYIDYCWAGDVCVDRWVFDV